MPAATKSRLPQEYRIARLLVAEVCQEVPAAPVSEDSGHLRRAAVLAASTLLERTSTTEVTSLLDNLAHLIEQCHEDGSLTDQSANNLRELHQALHQAIT